MLDAFDIKLNKSILDQLGFFVGISGIGLLCLNLYSSALIFNKLSHFASDKYKVYNFFL